MTVQQLRDLLDELPEDAEVRLMHQPSWPLEYSVAGIWASNVDEDDEDEDDGSFAYAARANELRGSSRGWIPNDATGPVVYLVEGAQRGYGTSTAWEEATTI